MTRSTLSSAWACILATAIAVAWWADIEIDRLRNRR